MKPKLQWLILAAFLLFTAFSLEEIAGEFVKFGPGRWTDSTGWNVSNRKSKINGDIDVMGSVLQNGSPIAGAVSYDTIVTKKDTSRFFHKVDTTRLAGVKRGNTFTGTNTFSGLLYTGTTETGNTTVTGTFDVNTGVATFGSAIQLIDNTKVITASGSDILYKVSTGGAHKFQTAGGTDLLTVDSASGIGSRVGGMSGIWGSEPLLRQKLIRGVAPTGNSTVTFAHGLTDGTIVSANIWLRHDTTATGFYTARNWYVHPNTTFEPTLIYYAGYDSLYCWARFPAGSTATRGDSLYFLLTYIHPN